MAVLFLSHASKDDALASALEAWLTANGFSDLFVDHSRIAGGDKWREALKEQAGACRVVLCLVTGNWLASSECYAEFDAAWYMGKRIIPLFLLGSPPSGAEAKKRLAKVQAEDQGLDLTACLATKGGLDIDKDKRIAELLKTGLRAAGALARIGLDPEAFEIDRKLRPTPFPGLAAFGDEDADAALFYGRSREIAHTLEELRAMRAIRDMRPLVILGASGAGKSSLLKAGIIPRLRREAPAWLPLRAFRPGADPLFNFAEALARTLKDFGKLEAPGPIRDRLLDCWSRAASKDKHELTVEGSAALEAALEVEGTKLRQAAGRPNASVLIGVDQAEEMARAEGDSGEALADYLRAALATRSGWQLAFTIRTDSFPELQSHRRFQNLEARGYDLRAIPTFRFDNVIEQPAKRYGVETETELIDALMQDAPKEDALPLLAFALERLWRQYAETRTLTKAYYDKMGGLNGLIEDVAERALRGIEPGQDVAIPQGQSPKRVLDIGAAAFLALAQINDQGAFIRQAPKWNSFDDDARDLLSRFDRWRLVVRKGAESDGGTVEVAHETLFREWSRLKTWLEPERVRLEALHALQTDAAAWNRNDGRADYLNHRDKRLADALALESNATYAKRLKPVELDYLKACNAAEKVAQKRARRAKALVGALVLVLVAVGIGSFKQKELKEWSYWFTQVRPYTYTAEQIRALAPKESFRDCAKNCPEMVVIPAGEFAMGLLESVGNDDESQRHRIKIAASFAVSRYEVTFADWDACVAFGPCQKLGDNGWGRGSRPVINVNWDDAKQYVAWLSTLTGGSYRLLTEAEWEYAARAKSATEYSFGDDPARLGQYAWYYNNSGRQTHPVDDKAKKPNAFGLYHMHGNVWEWVEDCYHENYNNTPDDGTAANSGDCSVRVVRGGSWSTYPEDLRSATRLRHSVGIQSGNVGFRVARTLTK